MTSILAIQTEPGVLLKMYFTEPFAYQKHNIATSFGPDLLWRLPVGLALVSVLQTYCDTTASFEPTRDLIERCVTSPCGDRWLCQVLPSPILPQVS